MTGWWIAIVLITVVALGSSVWYGLKKLSIFEKMKDLFGGDDEKI